MAMTIWMKLDDHKMRYGFAPEVGQNYVVVEYQNINSGAVWHQFRKEIEGISGNANWAVKRFHGWRGTTDNVEKTACGVRCVEKITTYKNGNSRINLSEDLHPEWE